MLMLADLHTTDGGSIPNRRISRSRVRARPVVCALTLA